MLINSYVHAAWMHFPWVRKRSLSKGKKSNQTILSLPNKKHRHTLQSHWWSWFCWWVVLKIFTEKISCMQSEHYLVSQIARQLNAPLLSVSLYTCIHIRTHIYTHTRTDVHTYSHCPFCLCNEHQEHWWQQQCSMLELSRADYLRIYFSSSVMPYLLFKEVKLMV